MNKKGPPVLRNRNFLLVLAVQSVAVFGDALFALALMWWVVEVTGSGAAMSAVTGADHVWYAVLVFVVPGLVTSCRTKLPGTCVCATEIAAGVDDGEPVMNGKSLPLPAEATRPSLSTTAWSASVRLPTSSP